MRIGELARKLNLRTSAIRYYEEIGLLPEPRRVSGRREYGPDAVERLRLLRALTRAGFSLKETRGLLRQVGSAGASQRWAKTARDKLAEIDNAIAELHETRAILLSAIECMCNGDPRACRVIE